MQFDREQILKVIYDSIDELNEQFARESWLHKSPETLLFGNGGALDSLGFVNLVAILEEKCESAFGVGLSLTDDRGEPAGDDPFRSIGSLADYVGARIKESRGRKT